MEFIIPPQLLLTIASAIVLLAALAIRIARDAHAINQTVTLNRHLVKVSRARLKTGVSVVIELSRRADTITPLLDRLLEQSYKKLEIIVVIKQTAGKNARPVLTRYKRAHPGIQLRLVTFKAGMTLLQTVRRFASKPLVMTISSNQKISHNFFSDISIDYALKHSDRIIPRRFGMLDNRLSTAFASHAAAMRSRSEITSPLVIEPGIVYKRASLLRPPKDRATIFSSSAYILGPTPSAKLSLMRGLSIPRNWATVLFVLVAVLGLTYVGAVLTSPDKFLLLGLTVGAYVFMYVTNLITLKAYSPLEKISLVLLSPVFMLYQGLSYIWSTALALIRIPKQIYNFGKSLLPRKKYS